MTVLLLTIAIAALIALAVAAARAAAARKDAASARAERDRLTTERDGLAAELERLRPLETKLATAEATLDARDAELERLRTAHDGSLDRLSEQGERLSQVSERLDAVKQKAEEAAKKGRAAAEGSERAERLLLGWTRGISNPRSRGALGELAVERQLSELGLEQGRDFVTQEAGNDGKRRDLVVRAGDARVIIDSKWTGDPAIGELGEVLRADDGEELVAWGRRIRDRARSLAERHYARGEAAGPRLVLMYVPVEGAYAALSAVEGFSLEKFSRDTGVYVVTPSQMGLAISLVAELWREAGREEQLLEIARELAGLGDRTAELVSDLDAMGRSLRAVVNHYNRIIGRLSARGGFLQQTRAVWSYVGRRFKRELLRGADGELLRLEQPRDDAATHADPWRDLADQDGDRVVAG